jgi:outer membrane protein
VWEVLQPLDLMKDNKGHSFGVQTIGSVLNGFSARNNVERSQVNFGRSSNWQ